MKKGPKIGSMVAGRENLFSIMSRKDYSCQQEGLKISVNNLFELKIKYTLWLNI